jgi:fatty acid desaturase
MIGNQVEFNEVKKNLERRGLDYALLKKNIPENRLTQFINIFFIYITFFIIIKISDNSQILSLVLFSLIFGFLYYFLALYFHSASHYGFFKNKSLNDTFTNIFLSPFFGESIKSYRIRHFKHHSNLAKANDPENSYTEELNIYFFAKYLIGLKFIQKIRQRNNEENKSKFIIISAFFYLIFFVYCITSSRFLLFFLVIYSFVCIFPLLSDLRLILEHKSISDECETKIFKKTFFSIFFGAAGFRNHLIHHWDPLAHYSSLDRLYDLINKNSRLKINQTSYSNEFIKIYKKNVY